MKELIIVSLLVCGVVSEATGPYAPSGWRPNGPSFELPEKSPVDPRNRNPQKQEYLPSVQSRTPTQEYGPPEDDVSVQGLPTQEQLPIFQLSPVNGQQYVGPTFNSDLKNLEQNLRQIQAQQNIYREFARQRQLEAAYANANRVNQAVPRQFAQSSTTTSKPDESRTSTVATTTETLSLNQGEVNDDKDNTDKKEKVSVEVTKQNVQEYPPELYLTPLSQLQLQNQFSSVQLGQLRAPIFLEPAQKLVSGYDAPAQLAALPALQAAYLAQLQLAQTQAAQPQPQTVEVLPQAQYGQPEPQYAQPQTQYAQPQPQYVQPQPQYVQPQPQYMQPQFVQPQTQVVQPQPDQSQQGVISSPAYLVPQGQAAFVPQSQVDLQPQYQPTAQQQPATQYQTVAQTYPQQPVFLQPQQNQLLPRPMDQQVAEQAQQNQQPQFVYQYQPAYQSPQYQQPQYQQPQYQYQEPLNSYQQDLLQSQLFNQNTNQGQQVQRPQDVSPLQSGFDVNQQGNGIDQTEERDDGQDDETGGATAVATAFGARTQPRVYNAYGAPVPVPRVQANPGYQYPSTEQPTTQESSTDDGSAVAEATAVARGRRPAKLRSRQSRVRPVFTLDRSGHLVLAQDQ